MKVLALICIVVIGCVNAISDEEISLKWHSYQEQFGKSYRSPMESRKRMAIFKDNLEKIEQHNALYEQGIKTHTQGINQFTDWTSEEFLEYVNKGLVNKPTIVGESHNKSLRGPPPSLDWRAYGLVSSVKNQGSCGSCWSFTAAGAIEGQLARTTGKVVSLSEQNLVDCSSSYGNYGCKGGVINAAFAYVRDNGIVSEDDYPYTGTQGQCQVDPSKILTKVGTYVTIPSGDEPSLQDALARWGPISVAIDATAELQKYSGGILKDETCSSRALNHGVLAVGYGSEDGRDFYILKNSWGAQWGEDGYFRLEKTNNNPCGIATMASYPILPNVHP